MGKSVLMKIAADIDARVEAKLTNQEKHLSGEKTNNNSQFLQRSAKEPKTNMFATEKSSKRKTAPTKKLLT